jgi:hypothetical protein
MTIPNSASMFTPAQRERMEQLENDRHKTSTYRDHARANDEEGGRFAVEANSPAEQYPRLPETSPWSQPQPGLEPPLGADNEMGSPVFPIVLGEPHDVERAANLLLPARSAESGDVATAGSQPPQQTVPAPDSSSAARADGLPAPNPMGLAEAIPQSAHDALRRVFARRRV